jgi:DNA-binding NtrC family response regulator
MSAKKIYIVEDDAIIKLLLIEFITSMGVEVAGVASNATMAIEGIAETSPDLIVLDIGLQGEKDGVELAVEINFKFGIPFVFVTGNSDTDTIERARLTQPAGFIFKPFDEQNFTRDLEKVIKEL